MRRNIFIRLLACLLIAASAAASRGAEAAGDKSRYTLFNPTPGALMREFSTDRPDVTESPYTVDAGHFQVELSFLEYGHDDEAGAESDEFAVMPSNLKVGLTSNVDLQFVIEPYIHQRVRSGGVTDDTDGFGATQLRLKVNVFGNDEGDVALAVMPFVQFPTADEDFGGTDDLEGGLIVPLAISLPHDFSLGLMAEIDFVRNEADDGYGYAFPHTAVLGHPIAGELAGYVEYVGLANHDLGIGYIALAGGGLTYGLNENAQLDGGLYFGISDEAPDVSARVGFSFRI